MSSQMGVDPGKRQINKLSVKKKVLHCASLSIGAALPDTHSPSRCSSMLVLSRFLARATSLSVTLVQRDVLTGEQRDSWSHHTWNYYGFIFRPESRLQLHKHTTYNISPWCGCVCVLTIPSEWSASCRRWCRAHTPCRAPTGLCQCSRCWRTGSCGTGCPDRPSEPVYWTDSGVIGHNPTGTVTRWRDDPLLPRPDCCFVSAHHYTKNKYSEWRVSSCRRLLLLGFFSWLKEKYFVIMRWAFWNSKILSTHEKFLISWSLTVILTERVSQHILCHNYNL